MTEPMSDNKLAHIHERCTNRDVTQANIDLRDCLDEIARLKAENKQLLDVYGRRLIESTELRAKLEISKQGTDDDCCDKELVEQADERYDTEITQLKTKLAEEMLRSENLEQDRFNRDEKIEQLEAERDELFLSDERWAEEMAQVKAERDDMKEQVGKGFMQVGSQDKRIAQLIAERDELVEWKREERGRLECAYGRELADRETTEQRTRIAQLEGVIDKAAKAWLSHPGQIPWEGGVADAMHATVEEIARLEERLAAQVSVATNELRAAARYEAERNDARERLVTAVGLLDKSLHWLNKARWKGEPSHEIAADIGAIEKLLADEPAAPAVCERTLEDRLDAAIAPIRPKLADGGDA